MPQTRLPDVSHRPYSPQITKRERASAWEREYAPLAFQAHSLLPPPLSCICLDAGLHTAGSNAVKPSASQGSLNSHPHHVLFSGGRGVYVCLTSPGSVSSRVSSLSSRSALAGHDHLDSLTAAFDPASFETQGLQLACQRL